MTETGSLDAAEVARLLGLEPHPEGGRFRETFRDPAGGARGHSTAIYYLLAAGERSHWHRVDAAEIWHYYGGAPLDLGVSEDGLAESHHLLGPDLATGQRPQFVFPAGAWQSAATTGPWTLVGCTVAPGFDFSGFTLAPRGWRPGLPLS